MNIIQKIRKSTALNAILAITILSSGCSVVGLGVGAAIDGCTPDYERVEIDRVKSIKRKTKTVVHLDNGSLRTGKFKHLVTRPVVENTNRDIDPRAISIEEILVLQLGGNRDSLAQSGISGIKSYEYINLSDVTSVEARRTKYCKWIGLAVGLAIDFYKMGKAFSNMTFDLNLEGPEF
jgi:hypothetical protein